MKHDGLFKYSTKTANLGKFCFCSYSLKPSCATRFQDFFQRLKCSGLWQDSSFFVKFFIFSNLPIIPLMLTFCKTLLALNGKKFLCNYWNCCISKTFDFLYFLCQWNRTLPLHFLSFSCQIMNQYSQQRTLKH